jgi:HEAT repeat protein
LLGLTVVRLDPELRNRWGTDGVVVKEAGSGSPLASGDLITHVVSRRRVSPGNLWPALRQAMGPRRGLLEVPKAESSDGTAVLEVARDGETVYIELAVQKPKEWRKTGLDFEGARVVAVDRGYEGSPAKSPAEAAGLRVGDEVRAVIDEDPVPSVPRFREAVALARGADDISVYTHELTGIRLEAIRVLGELGGTNPAVAARLLGILEASSDAPTRRTAARALESLAAAQTGTAFLAAVLPYTQRDRETDAEIRRSAIAMVETLQTRLPPDVFDDVSVKALVSALSDPDPGVHFKAGVVLSRLGDRSLAALTSALQQANAAFVRDIAATALGDVGGSKAREALIAALRETGDVPLQLTIATALARIGDAPSRAELHALGARTEDSGVREFVRQLLETSSTRAPSAS